MVKTQLLKLLSKLPENTPIWIGVDAGEGWRPLEDVFTCNALDAPLDGDEMSDMETAFVESGKIPMENQTWELEDPSNFGQEDKSNMISLWGPILVIGTKGSHQEVKDNKQYRLRDKKAEIRNALLQEEITLKAKLENIRDKIATQNDDKGSKPL